MASGRSAITSRGGGVIRVIGRRRRRRRSAAPELRSPESAGARGRGLRARARWWGCTGGGVMNRRKKREALQRNAMNRASERAWVFLSRRDIFGISHGAFFLFFFSLLCFFRFLAVIYNLGRRLDWRAISQFFPLFLF